MSKGFEAAAVSGRSGVLSFKGILILWAPTPCRTMRISGKGFHDTKSWGKKNLRVPLNFFCPRIWLCGIPFPGWFACSTRSLIAPQNQKIMNLHLTLHSLSPEQRAALIETLGNLLDLMRYEIEVSDLEYESVWAALVREIEGH